MAETPTSNEDVENPPAQTENEPTTSADASSSKPIKMIFIHLLAVAGIVWGSVMTALYVREVNSNSDKPVVDTQNQSSIVDAQLKSSGALGMGAISHINVVVNDTIDAGINYYSMMGFYPASNADGPMLYTNITNNGFCVDAGFESCRVDIVFLKHEIIHLYLELFFYYYPEGDRKIPIFNTNDAGGIRHIAVEVADAVETYNELKGKDHQGNFITKGEPISLDPFPYTFFYWIDKYGVQWEFEEGRPVEYYHIAGITG